MKKNELIDNDIVLCFRGKSAVCALKEPLKHEDVQVATVVEQKEGRNVSYHGSDLYDIETTLKFENDKKFIHHSMREVGNPYDQYDFISPNDLDEVAKSMKDHINNQIKKLLYEIEQKKIEINIIDKNVHMIKQTTPFLKGAAQEQKAAKGIQERKEEATEKLKNQTVQKVKPKKEISR